MAFFFFTGDFAEGGFLDVGIGHPPGRRYPHDHADGPGGTVFDDWLVGTRWADDIDGRGGDDLIEGLGGDDLLAGRDGFDEIYGDGGRDTVTGGNGRDFLDGGPGRDRVGGGDGTDTLIGGPGDDLLGGDGHGDILQGEAGRDTLLGGNGDDLLAGGPGDDLLGGGPGYDRALGQGDYGNADIVRTGPDSVHLATSEGGTDRLEAVEAVRFADGVLELGPAAGDEAFLFRLYDAAFGRHPDRGLDHWAARMASGMAEDAIARAFAGSPEFARRHGEDPEPEALVGSLYRNALGREPDPAGAAYWSGRLESGMPEAALLLAFSESPEHVAAHAAELEIGLFYLV